MAVSPINIRKATQDDLEDILPLVQAYRVFYERAPDPQRERDFIEAHLRSGTSTIFIAEIGSEPAAFMQLFKTYSTVRLSGTWILEDLFVDPRFRKSGVGSALLERALQHARRDSSSGMFLETAHDNVGAQALYENAGWTREASFLKYNAPL